MTEVFPFMLETYLMVDFENVRELTLSRLPAEWRVKIFIGRSQNNVPFSIAQDAQKCGERLEWIKIAGDGRNNLDFHLSFYLGVLATEHPSASFVILSRDKGFDALLAHLTQRGVSCKRIDAFAEVATVPAETHDLRFTRVREVLAKIEKKSRPKGRKTLAQLISAVFQKKLGEPELQRLVERFIRERLITESNRTLTYFF